MGVDTGTTICAAVLMLCLAVLISLLSVKYAEAEQSTIPPEMARELLRGRIEEAIAEGKEINININLLGSRTNARIVWMGGVIKKGRGLYSSGLRFEQELNSSEQIWLEHYILDLESERRSQ